MALIQVKFDNTLKQSDIKIVLNNSSVEEASQSYKDNQPEVQQTAVYGILAPLVAVNNIVVDFTDILSFSLDGNYAIPHVDITIRDRYKLIAMLDTPSLDNELRVQILPKFDNIYKKINLTFYISYINIEGNSNKITIHGVYKAPKLTSSMLKSFGSISTYSLFENIAIETGLGFATNVEDVQDKKYVYCSNKSYNDILTEESQRACTSNPPKIYDYWIDWWNNIVFADIYERYNATDSNKDIQIWTTNPKRDVTEGIQYEPIQVDATFSNHIAAKNTELYVSNYKVVSSPGVQTLYGTDRVFSVYENDKSEYMDHIIQDGDVKNDIFAQFEYLGESYGDHNYLLATKLYDTFQQKIISNELIEIELKTPLLGIMKGNRVNFYWYTIDSRIDNIKHSGVENGFLNENIQTDIPLEDTLTDEKNSDGDFVLDKSISGQYLVTKCSLNFKKGSWSYIVTLARPISSKPKIIKEE